MPLYCGDDEDRPESVLGTGPNAVHVIDSLKIIIDVMLPGKMTPGEIQQDELSIFFMRRLSQAWRILRPELERAIPFRWKGGAVKMGCMEPRDTEQHVAKEAVRVLDAFIDTLPEVRRKLILDIKAAFDGDPAALTYAEVQLAYPGLQAIVSHRIAHVLYKLDVPIIPRIMSEWTHSQTGVDIHAGAEIGHGFFIDHATGVVIGETSIIGNNVKIYQGVTLGARSFPLDEQGRPVKHIRRHPRVEDNVVIYANATILGGDTVIGKGATIGGNVFLMESVPANSFVVNDHPSLKIKNKSG
ncbi:MAG: serine acetyltransferase [Spartobacteria bacterium]|nr:serine acetyltransferase [Spartobacteria bacterium]